MSKFMQFIIEHTTDYYGECLLEGVSRHDILSAVEHIMHLEKILPNIIKGITNAKWAAYAKQYQQMCVILGDILLRTPK
jgi:hypothetical protein